VEKAYGGIQKPKMEGEFTGGTLVAYGKDGSGEVIRRDVLRDEIPDIIGKDASEKLLSAEPQETSRAGMGVRERSIAGLDLKIGGEFHKNLYDRKLVRMKTWKKLGLKVEAAEFGGDAALLAHIVHLTPDVKAKVLDGGLSRFMPALTKVELSQIVPNVEIKQLAPGSTPKEVRQWILSRIGNEDVTNEYTGWGIGPKSGAKHTLQTNRGEKQKFVGETLGLIRKSIWLGRERHKGYEKKGDIKWQHLFYVPFEYDGRQWVAKLRVNETLHGEKLRDTRYMEVKRLAKDRSEDPNPSEGTDASRFNIAQLADLVKGLWPDDDVQLVRPENERRSKADTQLRIEQDLKKLKRN
jgi:hypothetical protein